MWNVWKRKTGCEPYEARLTDAVERAAERGQELSLSADLALHVSSCARCREGVESAELSRALLRWGFDPADGLRPGFMTRVSAAIRAEEDRRAAQRTIFWSPLEHLAGRVALVACAVVMVVSFYVYSYVAPNGPGQEVTELVQQPDIQQPQTPDEVLISLAERGNVR
ncbi:MAG TPA: hypothetical protein VLV89_07030 [Candidatus Acidoferrum sp.]|nr:hypothetical protein [Candidatus Acidoferrum sp.]